MARQIEINIPNNIHNLLDFLEGSSAESAEAEPPARVDRNSLFVGAEVERAKLLEQIAQTEAASHEQFVRGQPSREEAERQIALIHRAGRVQTGYHVDCWPPRPVSSVLHAEKIPNGTDRIQYLHRHVISFLARPHYVQSDDHDNSTVILADIDDVIDKISNSRAFRARPLHIIKEADLTEDRRPYLVMTLGQFSATRNISILLCTHKLVEHSTVPFAKLNIFYQVTDLNIFFTFLNRLTINSRAHRQPSELYVPLNMLDHPAVIEYTTMIAGLRGEEVSNELLELVERKCWAHKPQDREMFLEWANSIQQANTAEENRVREILGIRVEFWWNNHDTLNKVNEFVRPMKEIVGVPVARPWANLHVSEEEVTRM